MRGPCWSRGNDGCRACRRWATATVGQQMPTLTRCVAVSRTEGVRVGLYVFPHAHAPPLWVPRLQSDEEIESLAMKRAAAMLGVGGGSLGRAGDIMGIEARERVRRAEAMEVRTGQSTPFPHTLSIASSPARCCLQTLCSPHIPRHTAQAAKLERRRQAQVRKRQEELDRIAEYQRRKAERLKAEAEEAKAEEARCVTHDDSRDVLAISQHGGE